MDAAVASVQAQMAADRKTTALKSLQVLTCFSHSNLPTSTIYSYSGQISALIKFIHKIVE